MQINVVQHLHRTDPKTKCNQEEFEAVVDLEGMQVAHGKKETIQSLVPTIPR